MRNTYTTQITNTHRVLAIHKHVCMCVCVFVYVCVCVCGEGDRRENWIWVKDNERPHSLEAYQCLTGWSDPDKKTLSFSLSPPLSMSIHLV